jgi:hypothetical protein
VRLEVKTVYFDWLYDIIFRIRDEESEASFIHVCEYLHRVQFNDRIPNDDNRSAYGINLREEFALAANIGLEAYSELYSIGPKASLFEMLVGLARQANFIVDVGLETWFREFLANLKLTVFNDARFRPVDALKMERIIRKFNERAYKANGEGGIFPLKNPEGDQRQIEVWYQMSAYILEQGLY